jgi:hypothetical protein
MEQRWEIINWQNKKRLHLCDSEEAAKRLLPYYGKNHIMREVYFTDDDWKFYNKKGNHEQIR